MHYWLYPLILLIYGLAVLCVGSWVFADWFKRKGHFLSAYLWLLGITFLPLPVLIIYFLVRPKNVQTVPSPAKQCPFCGLKLEVESEVCPQCHNYLGEKLKIQR